MAGAAARRDGDYADQMKACSVFTFVILFLSLMVFGGYKWIMKEYAIIHSSCHPREYVQELQLPRLLNHTLLNSSIIIGLEFKRGAAKRGDVAMYRDLSLRLYYGAGEDPVANRTVPHFRMGDRRIVRYSVVVDAPRLPWEDASDKISGGSTVLLRLELSGKFKARDPRDPGFDDRNCNVCDCDWSEFEAGADVLVDASANMISNTSILFDDI